jgi:hypothetical protein
MQESLPVRSPSPKYGGFRGAGLPAFRFLAIMAVEKLRAIRRKARMNDELKKTVRTDTPWFKLLHSTIDAVSNARLSAKRLSTLDAGIFRTGSIAPHEGLHRIADPRYKEWW